MSKLSAEWRHWLIENHLRRIDHEEIAGVLAKVGVSEEILRSELKVLSSDEPLLAAFQPLADRLQKLESLLEILAKLDAHREYSIPEIADVSRQHFFDTYYSRNQPVLISGFCKDWPAFSRWTPKYLKERHGETIVEVMTNRESDPDYELNMESHKERVTFADFVDRVENGGPSNDYYLVANNFLLEQKPMQGLLEDIVFPEILDATDLSETCSLWYGPANTITQPHHDEINVLLTQIRGRKTVTMVSPFALPWIYNSVGVYSDVDWDNPDLERFPLFQNVKRIQVTIDAGDALFIPVGWWHHVKSLDPSISIAFSNFSMPNHYSWTHPNAVIDQGH